MSKQKKAWYKEKEYNKMMEKLKSSNKNISTKPESIIDKNTNTKKDGINVKKRFFGFIKK